MQRTADEMRVSDWSSDVCSSDLEIPVFLLAGIMVAGEKEHRDFGPIQAAHGAGDIEAGAHVLPLTVEEVASDHDEIDIVVDGALYQIVKSRAGRSSYVVLRQTFLPRQGMERAVELNVVGKHEKNIDQR